MSLNVNEFVHFLSKNSMSLSVALDQHFPTYCTFSINQRLKIVPSKLAILYCLSRLMSVNLVSRSKIFQNEPSISILEIKSKIDNSYSIFFLSLHCHLVGHVQCASEEKNTSNTRTHLTYQQLHIQTILLRAQK